MMKYEQRTAVNTVYRSKTHQYVWIRTPFLQFSMSSITIQLENAARTTHSYSDAAIIARVTQSGARVEAYAKRHAVSEYYSLLFPLSESIF